MKDSANGRVARWLEERTGLLSATRALVAEPVPGGAKWFRTLGAAAAVLVGLQAVTGVFLALFYAPSASTAWASTAYIQDQLTWGWLVRGLHSFGSSALIVVTGLHLLQILLWGAYKAPREVNWIVGLVMLGLVLAFAFTGYALPSDQNAYWAKFVETSVLGSLPFVGPVLESVARGGGAYGHLTVIHFFAAHVLLLPAALATLLVLHIALVRRHRLSPHWNLTEAESLRRAQPYFPYQASRDFIVAAVTAVLVVLFVVRDGGAALEGPADPGSNYMARPDWYALPQYQLRLLFQGPLEILATLVIPGLVGGALIALPFLDRGRSRRPRDRWPVIVATGAVLVAMGVLGAVTIVRDAQDPAFQKHRAQVAQEASHARALARRGVLPEGGLAVLRNDPAFAVRELFADKCGTCHTRTGAGGGEAPDLADYNSRQWLLAFLREPYGERFMGGTQKSDKGAMRPVDGTPEELAALVELIYAESGAPDVQAPLVARGLTLFTEKNCDSCHGIEDPREESGGPNLMGRGTLAYTKRIIEHSGAATLYGIRAKMPRFATKLSPGEVEGLAQLVLELRTSPRPASP